MGSQRVRHDWEVKWQYHIISRFAYPSICWKTLGLFPFWGYYEQCSYKYFCTSFCVNILNSVGYIPNHRITGLYDNSLFNLFWNCLTFSKNWLQHCTFLPAVCETPISLHPQQHLLLSIFLIIAILVEVKWYFIVVFVCISLIDNG